MGKIEQKIRNSKLQKTILLTLETVGLTALALLAPNVIFALKKMGIITHKREIESIKRTRQRMYEKGLISLKNENVGITNSGRAYLYKCLTLGDHKLLNRNKKWDKKWRVLIFDIPESRKSDRDKIRNSLLSIGFSKLQNSVWVYPYDCENIISLLKADTEIGDRVLYMIAEVIENEDELKKHFDL